MTTHAGVTGNGSEESSEDHTDTDTGTTETDGSGTHTKVLGDLNHGSGDFGVEVTGRVLGHQLTGGGGEDLGSLLTLDGLESGGTGGWDTCEKSVSKDLDEAGRFN